VPQLFTDISLRCLAVVADASSGLFFPPCLPDRFGLDIQKTKLQLTESQVEEPSKLSTKIIRKEIETMSRN
jgi:hypothetical protein